MLDGGWSWLFRTANVAQNEIAEQAKDDEESEQHQCVHPEWCVTTLFGEDSVDGNRRRFTRRADGKLALGVASANEYNSKFEYL